MSARNMKLLVAGAILVVLVLLGIGIVRGGFFTEVANYSVGYSFDLRTGKIARVGRTGLIYHTPYLVEIHEVDMRPQKVCISTNSRILNCKLVQFNPDGLELFLGWHGRKDYMGPDLLGNVDNTPGSFNNIMMSYAMDGTGTKYPFLTILQELKQVDNDSSPKATQ